MNGNAELLNFIYQNSEMGVDTLDQLSGITDDEKFEEHLKNQYREYNEVHDEARKMLNENGFDEKGIGALDKIKTYFMVNFQTLKDNSTSHIAEMLIIGSNMGIINAIKNIRKYKEAEPNIIKLMERLQSIEEHNVKELKGFL